MLRTSRNSRRTGFTLIEVLFASLFTLLVVGMMIPATIQVARMTKAVRTENNLFDAANLLTQRLDQAMTSASTITLPDANTVQIVGRIDTAPYTQTHFLRFKQRAHATTVEGDSLVLSRLNGTTGEEETLAQLRMVSREGTTAMFERKLNGAKPYVSVMVHVGDRTDPPSDDDDRFTGSGYQGFAYRATLTPVN